MALPMEKQSALTVAAAASETDSPWNQLLDAAEAATYCEAWLALLCAEVAGVGTGILLLKGDGGAFVPAAVWPDADTDVSYLGGIAQRCLSSNEALSEAADDRSPRRLYVAYPLAEGDRLHGCIVLDLPAAAAVEMRRIWRQLHWGSGRLETMLLQRELQERSAAERRARIAIDILSGTAARAQFDEALMHLANQVAETLDCDTAAVGVERGGRIRLLALSNCAWFEPKATLTVAFENAMEEACDQLTTVCYPPNEERGDRAISVAHRELNPHGGVCTVPLVLRGRPFGAITCLRSEHLSPDSVCAMEAIAALVGPALAPRVELRRWFAGRLAQVTAAFFRACRDPRRPSFRFAVVGLLSVIVFLSLADGTHRVRGRAVIEGEVQRSLAAPYDGFIAQAVVRAGQKVVAGQELARLDDRDLKLDQRKLLAEREQADRKYRDALARHDRPNARILSAQLAEANAQVALVEDKIRRASITAPFDGTVVAGDLSQMLGTPVEKGKVLFEVAPLDAYRVILKVPETEIRAVSVNQPGHIVLAGISGEKLPFKVKNVGVASAEEGENLFRVEADLDDSVTDLRPGMEGVGKVTVGQRRLVWIWTHPLVEWLYLKAWALLP